MAPAIRFLLALTCLLVVKSVVADDEQPLRRFSLTTAHMIEPIAIGQTKVRRISITGTLDKTQANGSAVMTLDPNACGLNPFGDPEICTLIAAPQMKVTLEQVRQDDPKGQGRLLYQVKSLNAPQTVTLVLSPDLKRASSRIIIEEQNKKRVLSLEPIVIAKKKE